MDRNALSQLAAEVFLAATAAYLRAHELLFVYSGVIHVVCTVSTAHYDHKR
jgi:hypothetical protein